MRGRSPARFLAPVALVATFIALLSVLGGGGGDEVEAPAGDGNARPAATAPSGKSSSSSKGSSRKSRRYTVKAGDTPSSIADEAGIPLDRLLELNPDIDPQALSPGQRLKLGP